MYFKNIDGTFIRKCKGNKFVIDLFIACCLYEAPFTDTNEIVRYVVVPMNERLAIERDRQDVDSLRNKSIPTFTLEPSCHNPGRFLVISESFMS